MSGYKFPDCNLETHPHIPHTEMSYFCIKYNRGPHPIFPEEQKLLDAYRTWKKNGGVV